MYRLLDVDLLLFSLVVMVVMIAIVVFTFLFIPAATVGSGGSC
jgi:hypothetical protein